LLNRSALGRRRDLIGYPTEATRALVAQKTVQPTRRDRRVRALMTTPKAAADCLIPAAGTGAGSTSSHLPQ
jgi:hypothetical protein